MVDGGLPFVPQFHLKAMTFQLSLQGTAVGGNLLQFLAAFVPRTVRVENDTLIQGISTEKLIELTGEFGLFIRVAAIELFDYAKLTAVFLFLPDNKAGEVAGVISDQKLVTLVVVLQIAGCE